MLTAAALLSSVTTVDAKTYCFKFGTAGGGSYCDTGRISTGVGGGALSGALRAWVHTNNDCVSGTSQGYGFLSKTPGIGKVSLMSDDILAENYGNYSTAVSYALPKKIRNGQPWSAWVGMNGTNFFEAGSGYIINVGDCQNRPVNHARKSTLDSMRELIRMHRNAKAISE
jgi:hypothetical protein